MDMFYFSDYTQLDILERFLEIQTPLGNKPNYKLNLKRNSAAAAVKNTSTKLVITSFAKKSKHLALGL